MNRETVITTKVVPGRQTYDIPNNVLKVRRVWMGPNRINFSFDRYGHKLFIYQVPMHEDELKVQIVENIYG